MGDNGFVFTGWAIVELFGHRRVAGYVNQAEMFGTALMRIDIPAAGDAGPVTQFYGGTAIYSITPTTEEIACRFAVSNRPEPANRWDLRALPAAAGPEPAVYRDADDTDGGDDDLADPDDLPFD